MRRPVGLAGAAALSAIFAGGAEATPNVVSVAPSGPTVAERVLRISVTFEAAPEVGEAMPAALLGPNDAVIAGALLDKKLWSPDRRTLTLLLDPARVKSGLVAREEAGPVLRQGERIGLQIAGRVIHRWMVVAGGCAAPDLASWSLEVPQPASQDQLQLGFSGPIDVLSRDLIAVTDVKGNRIDGAATLDAGERRWSFAPAAPWPRGEFRIVVHPRLETPCGDEPGEPFEHAAGRGLGSKRAALRRAFTIR